MHLLAFNAFFALNLRMAELSQKNYKFLLTKEKTHDTISKVSKTHAALAQLVERRLGKAEVGSSNLLGSFLENQGLPGFPGSPFPSVICN